MKSAIVSCLFFMSTLAMAMPDENVRLYNFPRAQPSPMCDLAILMRMRALEDVSKRATNVVMLNYDLIGDCKIGVPDASRQYFITQESGQCGSKIYEGRDIDGNSIIIQDNRRRLCRDLRPAIWEVIEVAAIGGTLTKLFSSP